MTNPDPDRQSRFLTRAEAAEYLNASPRWLATGGYGDVPHLTFGRMVRYDREALDRWAESRAAGA